MVDDEVTIDEALKQILNDEFAYNKAVSLLRNEETPVNVLVELSNIDWSAAIVSLIPAHPNCDSTLMKKLASHRDRMVRAEVVRYTTSPEVLENFWTNNEEIFFGRLTRNVHTPEHVLQKLVEYGIHSTHVANVKTRYILVGNVIKNPSTSSSTLYYIAESDFKAMKVTAVRTLLSNGELVGWPQEWVEEKFGVKLNEVDNSRL